MMRIRRLPAYPLYLGIVAIFSFGFTLMSFISGIYRVESANLTPFQLVMLGTALETTVFITEVPTGIVADIYSRRLSMVIGYIIIGLGFILEGSFTFFTTIILAQVVWGFGYTFISGAQDAWLADEIGEANLTGAYLRAAQFGQMGALAGILSGVLLGRVALWLPFIIGGTLIVGIGVVVALLAPESGFTRTPAEKRLTWGKFGGTLRDGLNEIRGKRFLTMIMLLGLFYGLASEGMDRLWEAHLLRNFTFPTLFGLDAVGWFGVIAVAIMVLNIAVTEGIKRFVKVEAARVTVISIFVLNALMVGGIVLFGLAGNFAVAVGMIMLVRISRRAAAPLEGAWLNKQIDSRVRATVLSMRGQVDAFGQMGGGPVAGAVGSLVSLRAALVVTALLLAPVLPLLALIWRWLGEETETPVPTGV